MIENENVEVDAFRALTSRLEERETMIIEMQLQVEEKERSINELKKQKESELLQHLGCESTAVLQNNNSNWRASHEKHKNKEYYQGAAIPAEWEFAHSRLEHQFINCPNFGLVDIPPRDVKVYDFFTLWKEEHMLELRLQELYHVIDYFIIFESKVTFSNHQKNLTWPTLSNRTEFASFLDKIVYVSVDQLEGDGNWAREYWSRKQMMKLGFEAKPAKEGDIFIMGDLDEIPRASVIHNLKNCGGWEPAAELRLRKNLYSYQNRHKIDWQNPKVAIFPFMKDEPRELRKESGLTIIRNAGWHCTFCFEKISSFEEKLNAWSHQEYNQPKYKVPSRIVETVVQGRDFFDQGDDWIHLRPWEVDMPSYLALNRPEKFEYMWDRVKWSKKVLT